MEQTSSTYRMPADFNPYSAIDAVRGLSVAIHWMHFEGPGTAETMEFGDKVSLDALVDMLQAKVRELHEYLHELGNSTSLHLPMNEAELEEMRMKGIQGVREVAAVYSIR